MAKIKAAQCVSVKICEISCGNMASSKMPLNMRETVTEFFLRNTSWTPPVF